jgi:Secretion system C-terminal sorting domain
MNIVMNKYKTFLILLTMLIFVLILPKGFAQESIRIMAYNMSNYNTNTNRNSYFISVIGSIEPDIYTAVEINSTAGAENCLDNVLNQIGYGTYAMGYISGSYNNNAIYYRSDKFNLVSATKLIGDSGDPKTCEFVLTHISTNRQIVIFGVHFPSSDDAARVTHAEAIRNITNAYINGEYFIAAGDFNFADATENSFNALVDNANSGYFIDPEGYDGTSSWLGNDLLFTSNSQDGLDRRKDLILNSQSVVNTGGIEYISGSFKVPGNIDGTSASVPQVYKDASDHLPVYADYLFYDIETPVELSLFTGDLNGNQIDLHWRTETEVNNYGFYMERKTYNSQWVTIGFVEGHGNSNSPKEYNFIDTHIFQPGTYYYRLKQMDNDGTYEYFDVITVEAGLLNNFYLAQNYPNPFNPETRIEFTLPEKQLVSLRIYNMLGELVEELINEEKEAGSHSIIFDGSKLPSGVYNYRLKTSTFTANKKMILIK